MGITRETLIASLARQRARLGESVVLTPVDSLPFALADREHTGFLHGLYLTDKVRDQAASRDALILFGGREDAGSDISAIHELLAESFGAADGSLRLLAGLQAHASIFMSISEAGQTVMLLPEDAGGHFSTHAILSRLGLRIVDIPIDYESMCVDRVATASLVRSERPDFIFVDRSEGLRYEDFSFIGDLDGPAKIFDASQYVTQIVTGSYPNPFQWGFQLILFSLHKSFPGPQKAGVVTRERDELWTRLVEGLGAFVSSSHAESTYLVGLTLLRDEWLRLYGSRMLETATMLEARLAGAGVPVVSRSRQGSADWPGTQHIWIEVGDKRSAFAQYERLAAAGIYVNYRKLPYDLGYGLRLGTTHSAVAGIDVGQVDELADAIAQALAGVPSALVRRRVAKLAGAAAANAVLPASHWLTKG